MRAGDPTRDAGDAHLEMPKLVNTDPFGAGAGRMPSQGALGDSWSRLLLPEAILLPERLGKRGLLGLPGVWDSAAGVVDLVLCAGAVEARMGGSRSVETGLLVGL